MNLNPQCPSPSERSDFSSDIKSSQSAPSYTPSSFQTSFASLSLHRSDTLRLLNFPQAFIPSIRSTIQSAWSKGIQREKTYGPSYEFKLCGYPWHGQSSEAIPSRILMRELLMKLHGEGWILHASTDVSKKALDKDTLVFRKQESPPPESEWISISFNQTDRLRLIGANRELINAVKGLLQNMRMLQTDCGWKDQRLGAWEFKINGYPWRASGEETMSTRFLLLRLLETLEQHGWSLYASIDQSTSAGDGVSETDSWFCIREKGWTPGSTVFHR
jgi:hypothetical protein